MAVYLDYNPYQGINAHYNSMLQNTAGGWRTFHNDHITFLKSELNKILPEGYYAVTENSLQIILPAGASDTRPDVLILARSRRENAASSPLTASTPTLEVPTADIAPDEEGLGAVVIYQSPHIPVTRIELLSPTNKTTERNHYLAMRQKTLAAGVNLVELDYLHETPTIYRKALRDYTRQEEGSFPYCIVISDPERTRFYCFHVDEPMPVLELPLLEADAVLLDFGAVYNTTFEDDRRTRMLIDYAELPPNIASYTPEDQKRIRKRIATLAAS